MMSAYDFPLLIKKLLLTPLTRGSDKEIVYRDGSRYGYPTLRDRIGRLGSALTGLGVRPGDTVAMMDWDSHRYLECYFAVPMLGAVLQTVNVRLSNEQIVYCINHAEASILICNLDFLSTYEAIRSELKVERVIWISETGPLPAGLPGLGEYEQVISRGDPRHAFADFDENTPATRFYTTGTTGLPKGVSFSHRQLVLHALSTLAVIRLSGDDDVYMPMTPMFHVHAWGFPYTATLAGCKQVYPGRYVPEVLLGLVRDEKVTITHCVPTILQMLLTSPAINGVDLRGLRMIIGGSAMPRALCEAALERGIDVFTGYGMSETCPLLAVSPVPSRLRGTDEEVVTRMKAGQALPLVELRVVDFDLADVPHDGVTPGEVIARAPWLTQSYYKNPEATETLWEGGYLHTQDIGVMNDQGYLQITDRLKDVIKTGGEWVSSLEIESIISQLPGVAEVAVIGLSDVKWGERPAAIVVKRFGAKLEAADVREQVMRHVTLGAISKFAVPEHVYFTEELPKTSVGKLNKRDLRRTFASPAPV